MLEAYIIQAACFIGGFVTCAVFSNTDRGIRVATEPTDEELEAAFKRVRTGTTTADDEAILRDAAFFQRCRNHRRA